MSGPYDQQQLLAQTAGRGGVQYSEQSVSYSAGQLGGQVAGFGAGQLGGQVVGFGAGQQGGQAVGFGAGQQGGQAVGFGAGQQGGQVVGFGAGQQGGQVVGFGAGQQGGQNVGQTVTQTSNVQRTTEVSSSRGERQRRQRNESSSSSSSDRGYKAGSGPVASSSYQQTSVGAGYNYGVTAGGDSFGTTVSGQRRQGRYKKEVIRLPDQAQGQVRQVRRRLPTPEPDTLERV
jgi:hypothetical protein